MKSSSSEELIAELWLSSSESLSMFLHCEGVIVLDTNQISHTEYVSQTFNLDFLDGQGANVLRIT